MRVFGVNSRHFGTDFEQGWGRAETAGLEGGTSGAEIYGGGGPEEAAAFIAETSAELSKIAQRHGLDTLSHLLDMTQLEADDWLRNRRRLS